MKKRNIESDDDDGENSNNDYDYYYFIIMNSAFPLPRTILSLVSIISAIKEYRDADFTRLLLNASLFVCLCQCYVLTSTGAMWILYYFSEGRLPSRIPCKLLLQFCCECVCVKNEGITQS